MFNIVAAVKLLGHQWRDKVVNIKCDNESAVVVCCTGKTGNSFLNVCLYDLWQATARYNNDLRISQIKSVNNILVDALSH